MDDQAKNWLHAFMYGLHYPAVLGTGIVVSLMRVGSNTIHAPAASVAVIAWAFFCLSFLSAIGFEKQYGVLAFILDLLELIGMFFCLNYLRLLDPSSTDPPLVPVACWILFLVVALQFLWRWAVGLKPIAFLDLKLLFLALLVVDSFLGDSLPGWHWMITIGFAVLAALYVGSHPYDLGKKDPTWFLGKFLKRFFGKFLKQPAPSTPPAQ